MMEPITSTMIGKSNTQPKKITHLLRNKRKQKKIKPKFYHNEIS